MASGTILLEPHIVHVQFLSFWTKEVHYYLAIVNTIRDSIFEEVSPDDTVSL